MSHKKPCGCDEYNELSRRHFLAASLGAASMLVYPAWVPRVAYAQSKGSDSDIIVSIFLRGGCDGLTLCVPHGENAYYAARSTLNIPRPDDNDPNTAIDLDGFFGFAPAMSPLVPAFDAGDLAIVHACGSVDESRSHFDAQKFMELGKARDLAITTGWLGRHLISVPPLDAKSILRAIGINPGLQTTLAGSPNSLPIPDPADFRVAGNENTADARLEALVQMYDAGDEPLRTTVINTERTIGLLDSLNIEAYVPANGAVYPDTEFGRGIRSTAALIKGDIGIEAIALDLDGWDTHEEQGPFEGRMAVLMTNLSGALSAFHADVLESGDFNVTVVVMSEFGRVVAESASAGTDHGHGNVMFVMGKSVDGGRVVTNWPGLEPEQLYQGQDLDITIDYRDILWEILQKRSGSQDLAFIFPDFKATDRGVIL